MSPRPPQPTHTVGAIGMRIGLAFILALAVAAATACSPDGLLGSGALPTDVADPATTKTSAGALAAYRGTLLLFRDADAFHVAASGVLSDELQPALVGVGGVQLAVEVSLDRRTLPEQQDHSLEGVSEFPNEYGQLHRVRGQAEEARGLLTAYGGDSARALIGHLHAVEGYSEILLADLFCSGIPLSTVDYAGDYTYQPGSTTAQVYQHALTLFDSALALAADSARVVGLAQVGRGRALLALGQYAQAAAAVANVADGFQYLEVYPGTSVITGDSVFAWTPGPGARQPVVTVADREGGNGLDYRSSGDPRTLSSPIGSNQFGVTLYRPNKYATDGSSPMVLADWIEARLIEAEAALQAGDVTTWLGKLNHLRETAITPALADTTDPGTAAARVDLTFRERAFWLFLTGHRQGDLRRLIRQYGRQQFEVYPTGAYPGLGFYGTAVNAPIPATEREFNPKFAGCIDRGA